MTPAPVTAAITALGAAAIPLPNAHARPDKTPGARTFSSPAAVKLAHRAEARA